MPAASACHEKKEVREIKKSIGIDTGKRKCVTCVMDADGTVLEESWYHNTADGACRFAARARAEYGTSKAVCESTGNHWVKTADAFENAGIPLELANPIKTKAIAWASIKNDTIDARTLAHLSRVDLVARCHIGSAKTRGIRPAAQPRIYRKLQFREDSPCMSRVTGIGACPGCCSADETVDYYS